MAVMKMAGVADSPMHMEYSNPLSYINLVSEMQAFVGLKLHAVVLAMCAHVPSILLEYRPKCLTTCSFRSTAWR